MKLRRIAVAVMALVGIAWMATPIIGASAEEHAAVPHFRHIVEIMMENQSYGTIIGDSSAPQINALANSYGLATNYFGVRDDNQFYCTPAMASTDTLCAGTTVNHTVSAPTLADQLTAVGKSWKGYFQSLPPSPVNLIASGPSANGPYTFKYPSSSNALYASKHNPFLNFTGTQGAVTNLVPDTQLASDLAHNSLPNFSLVVPDQWHDMHGTGGCAPT